MQLFPQLFLCFYLEYSEKVPIFAPNIQFKYVVYNMSTATLASLLDYLYGTLSPSNMRWVGEHLIEYSKKEESEQLRPYTMQEIDDMLDEAEAAFETGDYLTNDEVFHNKEKVTV